MVNLNLYYGSNLPNFYHFNGSSLNHYQIKNEVMFVREFEIRQDYRL